MNMNFLSQRGVPTVEQAVAQPVSPAKHSPELERERVDNLMEIGRLLVTEDGSEKAKAIAGLAFAQAVEICDQNNILMEEVQLGLPEGSLDIQAS